jgi:tripartite-type tricarboxylate transporter receptor subunit TctC
MRRSEPLRHPVPPEASVRRSPAIAALRARAARILPDRTILGACLFAWLFGSMAGIPDARAQSFPSKLVHIYSPYPAGIAPDVAVRILAERLSREWKQQVLVESHPGASGFLAIASLKKAKPDGHELLLLGSAHLALNPQFLKSVPYDPVADFAPVATIYRLPFYIVTAAQGPFATLSDLLEAARFRPNPVTYSTPYVGSPPHLGGALLGLLSGTHMQPVQFREGSAQATSVVSGDVDFHISASGTVAPLVQAGKLRLLAIMALTRSEDQPTIPTVTEAGGPSGCEVDTWVGLVAPRNTPEALVRQINADVNRALRDPETEKRLRAHAIEPLAEAPTAMAERIQADTLRYGALIRRLNLQAE